MQGSCFFLLARFDLPLQRCLLLVTDPLLRQTVRRFLGQLNRVVLDFGLHVFEAVVYADEQCIEHVLSFLVLKFLHVLHQ